jgi:twitching motility protein PilT
LKTADGKGRVAAFEILHANSAIRALIREGKSHQVPSAIQTSRKQGMITMDDSLFELYEQGRITKEEAITFAVDKGSLTKRLV